MKNQNLITITAVREKCSEGVYKGYCFTRFFKDGGKLFATIPPEQKQPRYGKRTITLNCWKWGLVWIDNRKKLPLRGYKIKFNDFWGMWQVSHPEIGLCIAEFKMKKMQLLTVKTGKHENSI